MSWRNDFSYKNLSFGGMLDMRVGGDIWSQSMSHTYGAGTAAYTVDGGLREREIIPGVDMMKQNDYVMMQDGKWVKDNIAVNAETWFEQMGVMEDYVFKGSFLKLRELYVTYNVPERILSKLKYIKRASVSVVANNVALLWVDSSNTLRLDPEAGGVSSDSRGVGFEQNSVPGSRSLGVKLNVTF